MPSNTNSSDLPKKINRKDKQRVTAFIAHVQVLGLRPLPTKCLFKTSEGEIWYFHSISRGFISADR